MTTRIKKIVETQVRYGYRRIHTCTVAAGGLRFSDLYNCDQFWS